MPALHGRRECRGHRKGLSFFANSAERGFPLIRTEAANTATQMLRVMRSAVGVAGG